MEYMKPLFRRALLSAVLTALSACSMATGLSSTKQGTGPDGSETTAHGQSDIIEIPNLFRLTQDESSAVLKRAGYTGTPRVDESPCGSFMDGHLIEVGQVCYQHPAAGTRQGARLPLTLRFQTEDPRQGRLGTLHEWHLMPDVVGMPLDRARREMAQHGLVTEERTRVAFVDKEGCAPLTVCRTSPPAHDRVGLHSDRTLFVGRDPKPPEADEPVPTPETPDTQAVDTTNGKPTEPEPFF